MTSPKESERRMIIERHPIRLATIQVYLFWRALRRLEKDATAELQDRGITRDQRIPVLDQLTQVGPR